VIEYVYSGSGERQICSICQNELEDKEQVKVLQCKHPYHPTCIDEWLDSHKVCPICKADAIEGI